MHNSIQICLGLDHMPHVVFSTCMDLREDWANRNQEERLPGNGQGDKEAWHTAVTGIIRVGA
jgi:hypothetical protein